jgi:hypothetical protein
MGNEISMDAIGCVCMYAWGRWFMWWYWGKIARFWAVDQLCGICSELRSWKKVGTLW